MTDIHKTIDKLINIPCEYYSIQTTTFESLLKASGYFEIYSQINISDIIKAINLQAECIEHWLVWSADKRVNVGWYFKEGPLKKYIVGYYSSSEGFRNIIEYTNINEACAVFIKHEIEDVASRMNTDPTNLS